MASDSITSWQIEGEEGEKVEAVTDFIFLGSKTSVDSDHSQEIQRCLLLGRKSMTNLDNVLQSRDITMLTKMQTVKAMVFPVVMHGFKSWSIKKADHQRTDAFEIWCWRRLRVPWCWKRLRAWEEGNRGWDGWMASSTQWTWIWANSGRSNRGQTSLVCCSPGGRKESDTAGQPTLHGHRGMYPGFLLPLKKYIYFYLFGCAGSQLHHVGSGSLTRDQTQAPCIGSTES